jgi:Cu/Ag efflux pump CusA
MRLTELSLKNSAAVTSAALVISLFGSLALLRLPIQLLPDTRQPQLWINAQWREAAPNEVEERSSSPSRSP